MATADRVEEGAPSIEELRERARGNPNDLDALRALAWELYGLKRFDEAKEELQEAISKNPADPEVHYALGLVLRQMGEKDDARQSFQRTLEAIEDLERSPRIDMMRKLATGQINQLNHGTWDIPSV